MSIKKNLKILIVDDMSVSRGLVCQALDQIGLSNHSWEKDGAAALDRLVGSPVHLVISDYEMPKMNGLDLLESIRGMNSIKNIGFLLLTGTADNTVLVRGQKLGMNNYLKKPFTADQLKTAIEQIVGKLG